jgi:hypothetical protein
MGIYYRELTRPWTECIQLLIQPRIGHVSQETYVTWPPPTAAWRHHGHWKYSLYCCTLGRVYRAVAWQRVDQIRYSILNSFLASRWSNIVRTAKCRRLWCAELVAGIRMARNAYRHFLGIMSGERALGRHSRKDECNIKINIGDLVLWIKVTQSCSMADFWIRCAHCSGSCARYLQA